MSYEDYIQEHLITHVAIQEKDGTIHFKPKPFRHSDIQNEYRLTHETRLKGEEGFLCASGFFLDRKRARKFAELANQLLDRAGDNLYLTSEDVW